MSTGSRSATPGPPLASSWATPPEFYIDENFAGRTLRRAIADLGYVVHTPAQLYGSHEAAKGTSDAVWLRDVGRRGWAVIGKDTKVLERPEEVAAYRRAHMHMFLFPGQARRARLIELLHANLRDICTQTTSRRARPFRVRRDGLEAL